MNNKTANHLKIIFAGTPDFAARHLKAILDSGSHTVVAVYTQPDRPAGRGKKLTPSPVKLLAQAHDLPVYQPSSLKGDEPLLTLKQLDADVMVVVAYGLILPKAVLEIPKHGCINVHASILPRWRGAAPIQRAIEAGDPQTGITIMQMDEGLDTGDMLVVKRCDIAGSDTAASLQDRLAGLGCPALREALEQIANHSTNPVSQDDSQSCYATKINKEEAEIDWREPAGLIDRKIRAFNPAPVCYSFLGGQRVKIWLAQAVNGPSPQETQPGAILEAANDGIKVGCGEGVLIIKELQLPGKSRLSARDLLNAQKSLFAAGNSFHKGNHD